MNSELKKLFDFIKAHHVMGLATAKQDIPHVSPLFYALDEELSRLVFISDPNSRHMKEIETNSKVSAGIYLETETIGKIQGAQIWGIAKISKEKKLADVYTKRFPHSRIFIAAHPSHRFCYLQMESARLIDNTLGFGKKLSFHLQCQGSKRLPSALPTG